jgi:hypothetical protein
LQIRYIRLKIIHIYLLNFFRYELFVPLHELWLQYIEELYGKSSPNIFGQKLLKADFHGAILTGNNINIMFSFS